MLQKHGYAGQDKLILIFHLSAAYNRRREEAGMSKASREKKKKAAKAKADNNRQLNQQTQAEANKQE